MTAPESSHSEHFLIGGAFILITCRGVTLHNIIHPLLYVMEDTLNELRGINLEAEVEGSLK